MSSKATRLVRMIVKNVAAVDAAANKRTWLLVKSESGDLSKASIKSENERRRMIDQAVRDRWGSTNDYSKAYCVDIWDGNEAIISMDGEYYSSAFTVDADNKVSFGELTPVTSAWVEKRQAAIFAKRAWSAETIAALPDSSFALVKGTTRLLPYKTAEGDVDVPHLRHAIASLAAVDASEAEKAAARTALAAEGRAFGLVKDREAITFDDALFARRIGTVMCAIGEHYGALMETLYSIRESEGGNKGAAVKDALSAFQASLQNAMPDLLAEVASDDLEKAGRKISAERLAKLKSLYKTLSDIIQEQETQMAEKAKGPDAGTLAKFGATMAAMIAKMTGADDATVTQLEKAASGEAPEPAIPANVQAVLSKADEAISLLSKANEKLTTDLATATTQLAELQEAASLRKFAEEVVGFKDIGLDPAKDAILLKSIDEKLPKEMADRIRELFKAQLAQKGAAGLLREVGSTGSQGGSIGTSAAAELEQKIAEVMTKSAGIQGFDRAKAMDQVYRENDGLYARVREESNVRV